MRALILVELQKDFAPGGTLPVPKGDQVVPVANNVMAKFDLVVAVQDWHPRNHASFASQHPGRTVGDVIELDGAEQVLWPDHCVRNSPGAQFMDGLNVARFAKVFQQGTDARIDSHSGFFDVSRRRSTGLGDFLRENNVADVYIAGLATDYCVKFTALDARELGFATLVVEDACRGVNLDPNDVADALKELRAAGVKIVTSRQIEV